MRARHAPVFHDFGMRYLERHLPRATYEQLEPLCFAADARDLADKLERALAWAERELAAFDIDAVAATLDERLANRSGVS